jgi:hypothetical protein
MINTYPNFREMRTIEVFVYHDRPLLFSAQDILGHKYLAVLVEEEETFEEWIYVAVSQNRLEMIRSGGIDLHDAFGKPENRIVFRIKNDFDGEEEVNPVLANELPIELLPKKGAKLNLEEQTLPTIYEEINRAVSTLREAISLKLNFHQINRTEAPAHTLGNILVSFQDSLNSLLNKDAWLRVVGFEAGSFKVLLDAEEQSDLFDNSNVADALKLLEKFIESSNSEEVFNQSLLLLNSRAKKNLKKLLENISGDVISTEIEWHSPKSEKVGKVYISNEKALSIYEKIVKLSEPQIKIFEIKGTLEGIDIRTKHFRIVSLEDHTNYSGYMKDESVAENSVVQSAQINQVYLATIEESTNPEELITKYKLIKLDHI